VRESKNTTESKVKNETLLTVRSEGDRERADKVRVC